MFVPIKKEGMGKTGVGVCETKPVRFNFTDGGIGCGDYCIADMTVCPDGTYILYSEYKDLLNKLDKANELISFDINKASDGAAMNHANKLDAYRKELKAK